MLSKLSYCFKVLIFFFIFFFLYRFLFFTFYFDQFKNIPVENILYAFILGIRFDIATIFILCSFIWCLVLLPVRNIYYYFILHSLTYIILFMISLISISDIIYFAEANKRISFEIKIYLQNFLDINTMIILNYTFILFLCIFCLVIIFYFWNILFKKDIYKISNIQNHISISIISLLLFIFISIIAIRGGLQSRPLKPAMSFQNSNHALGSLALNGIYTTITALYKNNEYPIYNQNITQLKTFLSNVFYKKNKFIGNTELFYREHNPKDKEQSYNIVILVMESWGYKDLGRSGNIVKPTPFFDKISKQGYFFKNHYSSGLRTLPMMGAIVNSIPSVAAIVYSNSLYQNNHNSSVANILKEKGYKTIFMYAAKDGSMGFSTYAPLVGFEKVITKSSFNIHEVETDNVWGVYDEYSLQRLHKELSESSKPVFAMFMSLHPHIPFTQPKHWKGTIQDKFYNDMNYTDQSLELFFLQAQTSSYFSNTIFIIVGDHAYGNDKKGVEIFHTPLLIYAPSILKPVEYNHVVSHLDIAPTIIDLLSLKVNYGFMGGSMLDQNRLSFAMVDFDTYMGWIENDTVSLFLQNKLTGLYNYKQDRLLKNNLLNRFPNIATEQKNKYLNYISSIGYVIKNDKIVPFKN